MRVDIEKEKKYLNCRYFLANDTNMLVNRNNNLFQLGGYTNPLFPTFTRLQPEKSSGILEIVDA